MKARKLPLRWRLLLWSGLIPILLVLPVLAYVGQQYQGAYRANSLGEARVLVRDLQRTVQNITPYISSIYDVQGLRNEVRTSGFGLERVAFVALVFDTGTVLYHSNEAFEGRYVVELAHLQEGELRRNLPVYGETYLVVRSVKLPGLAAQRDLFIVAGVLASQVNPPLVTLAPVLAVALAMAAVVGLVQFATTRWVLNPLNELAQGVTIIGAGNLSHRIPVRSADEIGFLTEAFNAMASRLSDMVESLEEKVAARTADLERKSRQLQAASLVSREAALVRDVPTLLRTAVNAISQNFGFYHAGIFLVDERNEWVLLQAASSEGGRRMLARGHKLQVGRGIVGTVAATGRPRIALDVGGDVVWVRNPDLPDTRSELALPLRVSTRVIGVLDVQSTEPAAFTTEDEENLQLMADQLAIALENARLLEQMQGVVQELEALYQDYSREGWARVMTRIQTLAYEYDRVTVYPTPTYPLPPTLYQPDTRYAMARDGGRELLMQPLRLGQRLIGVLSLYDPQRTWTREELELVQGVGEQAALALENARLFEEAQRNARQQALLNAVLRTAASASTPEEALQQIAQILAQGLRMAVLVLTFEDPVTFSVRVQAFLGADTNLLMEPGGIYTLTPEQQLFFRGLAEAELAHLLDVLSLPDEARQRYTLERVLYVPIRTGTAYRGVVGLMSLASDPPLDPEMRVMARNLARQVAVVLENMSLLEETRQRSLELQQALAETELLYQATGELTRAQDYASILETLRRYTVIGQEAHDVSIQLFNRPWIGEQMPEWTYVLARWYSGEATPIRLVKRYDIREFGLSRFILSADEPGVISDLTLDPRLDRHSRALMVRLMGARSALFVPLLAAGQRIGFINALYPQPRTFDDNELRRLMSLTQQAAVAIQNISQLAASEARARRERLIREITGQLQAAPDVQSVLRTALRELGRALGTPQNVVQLLAGRRQGEELPPDAEPED